jgi:hypothetical protein
MAFSGIGLGFPCTLNIYVIIWKVFSVCYLDLRRLCCSPFRLGAAFLPPGPYFYAKVPHILSTVNSFFYSGGYFIFTYGGFRSGYGGRDAGIHRVVSAMGYIFTVACLLVFVLARYTVGLRFAFRSGSLFRTEGVGYLA